MKLLQRAGWFLSYFQIWVLIPFGTCTQGDDDPWAASLFYLTAPLLGLVLILVSSGKIRKSLMGAPHVITLGLILWNTPSYWLNVTFQGRHICAGYSKWHLNSFEPEIWHRFWAPVVTITGLAFVVTGFIYFRNYIKDHGAKRGA